MKSKNLAFSMAEVMITLVILGVIAVLTVPGLVDSANKRINEAAQSKADYVVGQAALRLQAECPRLRCDNPQTTLSNLLDSVKANEKLTYGVSEYDSTYKRYYVLVVIEGDDVPILFSVNRKGKGVLASTSAVEEGINSGKSFNEVSKAKTLKFNKIIKSDGKSVSSKTISEAGYSKVKTANGEQ